MKATANEERLLLALCTVEARPHAFSEIRDESGLTEAEMWRAFASLKRKGLIQMQPLVTNAGIDVLEEAGHYPPAKATNRAA